MKQPLKKNRRIRQRSWTEFVLCISGGIFIFAGLFFLLSNLLMMHREGKKIVPDEELLSQRADCILILGAGVWEGNTPSPMLSDRLEEGLRLYSIGAAPKILVSGDHGKADYDEVNVMKDYLKARGVPGKDIFMDHAGFSTYESICRARDVFNVSKIIVVTQRYHLYRALYICGQKGIDALGSGADPRSYRGAFYRNVREWISRDKDILYCWLNVKPTYLGDQIDIHGDGSVTDDK